MSDFRYWFLTWRTYGTWLSGDDRGFVGPVVMPDGRRVVNNGPGTPMDEANPFLRRYAASRLKADPVRLEPRHAADLLAQLRETADHRGWLLLAAAVLSTHVHLVVRVEGDPDGEVILRDFKSYASRRLNQAFGPRSAGSWWSESGSRRVLRDECNVREAVDYVAGQEGAYLIWVRQGERPA